jgi:hypothetical protein
MGYYIRILSPAAKVPSLARMTASLAQAGSFALAVEDKDGKNWTQLLLAHTDHTPIAEIERNIVRRGELGAEEVEQFLDEIADCKPPSAVEWLRAYLPKVKTIYAFQVLSGADQNGGWSALYAVRDAIRESAGGIMQSDGEGFSNEEGFHILWQFSMGAKGPWWMAVRRDSKWTTFQMELGNRQHRQAFVRGELPAGMKPRRPRS